MPRNETEAKIQKIMMPILPTLERVSEASKKKIPDNDTRLKLIKQGLITIGTLINTHVREPGQGMLEEKMWVYVSDHHWPQSKHNDQKVSGQKLREMYKKIVGKDAAKEKEAPKKVEPITRSAVNGLSVNGLKEEDAQRLSEVKKETHTSSSPSLEKREPADAAPASVKMATPEERPAIQVKIEAEVAVDDEK